MHVVSYDNEQTYRHCAVHCCALRDVRKGRDSTWLLLACDTGNLIYAGVEEVFSAAAQAQYPVDYKNIVREVPLQDLYGYYETMGDLGAARLHSEEADIMYHKIEWNNRTTITSRVYENGVKGSLESMHFDKYNIIESYFGKPLVQTMVNMKERVVAEIYNGVFSDTGADGVALAAATHPLKNDSSKLQ